MLDYIGNLASEVDTTFKTVITVVAAIAFVIMSAKGGWTAARMIISAVVAALLIAIVWNIDVLGKRMETDLAGPAIIQPILPKVGG